MKNSLVRSVLVSLIVLTLLAANPAVHPAQAQSGGVYYIVKENDSLTSISEDFHTSPARIALANYITDMNYLAPGRRLLIPGFSDLSGTLTQISIGLGDTPRSLMRASHSDESAFTRINFLTSADAVVVGKKMYTLTTSTPSQERVPVTSGLTGLELAASKGIDPWTAAEFNSLSGTWDLVANDILYLPSSDASQTGSILPGITSVSLSSLQQGKTAVFSAAGTGSTLSGSLDGYPLNIFPQSDGSLMALQGIPRMTTPGPVSILLTATLANGSTYSIQQNLMVKKVDYGYDVPMQVNDETIDPKITGPEDDFLFKTTAPASSTKMWSGAFLPPTATPDCKTDTYGKLRSFNGSDWIYWHSGTDYCGGVGDKIFAAAAGIVVYTGELTVRGYTTIIDHGNGVYTGYYHQSQIEVKTGDKVSAGQEIGLIGDTGRVTGPHLHFDLLVGDVQVDSDQWLYGQIP